MVSFVLTLYYKNMRKKQTPDTSRRKEVKRGQVLVTHNLDSLRAEAALQSLKREKKQNPESIHSRRRYNDIVERDIKEVKAKLSKYKKK